MRKKRSSLFLFSSSPNDYQLITTAHVVVDRRQAGTAGVELALGRGVAALFLGGARGEIGQGRGAASLERRRRRFQSLER